MCWVTKNETKSSYSDYADNFMLSWCQMKGIKQILHFCWEKWVCGRSKQREKQVKISKITFKVIPS